jgi:hypothetical protein
MSDQRSDIGAERAILAACMESRLARDSAREALSGADFDDPRHEAIFDAMIRLDHHGKAVDATTLNTLLAGTPAQPLLVELVTTVGIPEHVSEYAAIIRGWSTKRQIESTCRSVLGQVLSPEVNPVGFAAAVATRFATIRDSGATERDFTALTLDELLAVEDDEPDWLVPGLLESRDRFMLTGEEGLGKSHWLRQFALHAAAGVHPLDASVRFDPIRTLIVDCENTWSQVRRKLRGATDWLRYLPGAADPTKALMVDCIPRIDITRDRDLARIHHVLDEWEPAMVVIGPLYRLYPRALQTDDDAAPVLAALDTIRDRGCALLMEAHAGHAIGKGGVRDLRPRGSSALLGWPEFGFGMRNIGTAGYADLVQWRGPREEREWPQRLKKADGFRWIPHADLYGWNEGGAA